MAAAMSTPATSAGSNPQPWPATSLAAEKEPIPARANCASDSWPV